MRYEPEDKEYRREQDLERLGTRNPTCLECDETDPVALTGTHPAIYCYEHDRLRHGLPIVEGQHAAGKANTSVTTSTLGNDHRIWDDAKADWPERTRTNPDGSPVLAAAAAVRSVLDWFTDIIGRVLGWVPPFLEALDEYLAETLGITWWSGLSLGGAS